MKKKVLILCGGKSGEHEISLSSAKCVLDALDQNKYEPIIVGISKEGVWHYQTQHEFLAGEIKADKVKLNTDTPTAYITPFVNHKKQAELLVNGEKILFDVAFPILHGPFGEDGTIQGMFELMGLPFVGSGCTSSNLCMDKILMKLVCEGNNIPTAPFIAFDQLDILETKIKQIKKLNLPVFVKPNRLGSSVGISKVDNWDQLQSAIDLALSHDEKCLIEQAMIGREIECAVLGLTHNAKVAAPGEIIPNPEIGFYSYEGKYLLEDGAVLDVPAKLSADAQQKIKLFVLNVYKIFECSGMARVDLFYNDEDDVIYLNEPNTIPGFTPTSMYPKMWEQNGLSYQKLITQLIELAFLPTQ